MKHNPHLSFSPVAVSFRAATSIPGLRGSKSSGDLDIDFYSIQGNEENSLFPEEIEVNFN